VKRVKKIKIVVIGAGSRNFGRKTIVDLLSSDELKETDLTVSLVDVDETALNRMFRFAQMVKEYRDSSAEIEATTDRRQALKGADYVITAVARKRYELWDRDFFLPFSFGFKHNLGENGGPGAAFHTLRSLHLMIPIARDMEELCPDALFLTYTNPVSRVCMGLEMLTSIRFVGLCNAGFATLEKVAQILDRQMADIEIDIGGFNHFHWLINVRDKATGKDLYPELRRRIAQSDVDLGPFTRMMYETFGILPFPADVHIGEYVQFAYEVTGPYFHDPVLTRWRNKMLGLDYGEVDLIQRVVEGKEPISELAKSSDSLPIRIICDIEFDRKSQDLFVNVPNEDFAIPNLPEDAIVEIRAMTDARGVHPMKVGPLPEAIAAMCRTQISIQKLMVEAYAQRSKKLLLQALAIDPTVDSIPRAQKLVDKMLSTQKGFLPDLED
jgi:alpha-galactosidase